MAITIPDLSGRPVRLTVEPAMATPAATLYRAWTEQFDRWFAAAGTVLMRAEVDAPFFFETRYRFEARQEATGIRTTDASCGSRATGWWK